MTDKPMTAVDPLQAKADALCAESAVRREYGRDRKRTWQWCLDWADKLSDAEVRAAKKLSIPDDPGLAIDAEFRRRFDPWGEKYSGPRAKRTLKR